MKQKTIKTPIRAVGSGVAALFILGLTAFPLSATAQDAPAAKVLPAPPLTAKPASGGITTKTRLKLVFRKGNDVTDTAAWFKSNNLVLPAFNVSGTFGEGATAGTGPVPGDLPTSYNGNVLTGAMLAPDAQVLLYGPDYASARYLLIYGKDDATPKSAYDLGAYVAPLPGGKSLPLPLVWATTDRDTLYVGAAYNGYAREAGGKTGYITALNAKTGALKWQSRPLVANAHNFAVLDDAIICGYGFTDEKDYLYVLDKRTGRIVQTLPLKTGPDYILVKGDRVYVRTYDTDYVFAIKRR